MITKTTINSRSPLLSPISQKLNSSRANRHSANSNTLLSPIQNYLTRLPTIHRNLTMQRMTDLKRYQTVWSTKVLKSMKIKRWGKMSQKLLTRLEKIRARSLPRIMTTRLIKMCRSNMGPAIHPQISNKKAHSNTNRSIKEVAKLSKGILRSTRLSIAKTRFKRHVLGSGSLLDKKLRKTTLKSCELIAVMQPSSIETITIF